jgi:hypothetical protein
MAATLVTPVLHRNIGCYILAHLLCHNLETNITCLIDSGAQQLGLLPFASLPTVLHSRLVMKVMSHPILGTQFYRILTSLLILQLAPF